MNKNVLISTHVAKNIHEISLLSYSLSLPCYDKNWHLCHLLGQIWMAIVINKLGGGGHIYNVGGVVQARTGEGDFGTPQSLGL